MDLGVLQTSEKPTRGRKKKPVTSAPATNTKKQQKGSVQKTPKKAVPKKKEVALDSLVPMKRHVNRVWAKTAKVGLQ